MNTAEEYLKTIERLEPDITPIDASAFYASVAISLKRIADAVEILAVPSDLMQQSQGRAGGPGWPNK